MYFSPTNILFVLGGLMLSVYAIDRYIKYKKEPQNHVTRRYFIACTYVSLALFIYGVPVLLTENILILSILTTLACILSSIGFSNFFFVTLRDWLSRSLYIITKYSLYLYTAVLTIFLILTPPQPRLDDLGIIHWNFSTISGWMAALQMDIIFIASIVLIFRHFYRLKKLSIINSLALIITFLLTGFSGTYLYVGKSPALIMISSAGLFIGLSAVFISVIHGYIVNRRLKNAIA